MCQYILSNIPFVALFKPGQWYSNIQLEEYHPPIHPFIINHCLILLNPEPIQAVNGER